MKKNPFKAQPAYCVSQSGCVGALWVLAVFLSASPMAVAQTGPAGSLDTTFSADLRAVGYVYAVASQTNGISIIGGWFRELNGVPCQNLGRVDAAGNLDTSFSPEVNAVVYALAMQPDGKVVIGGDFTAISGVNVARLARLTSNGQTDPAFQTGSGFDGRVCAVVVQPDGGILVAGRFANFQGVAQPGLIRLLSNGSRDPAFQPALATGSQVYALAVQPDSRIVLGGWFSSISGVSRRCIARLNANGSLDTSFAADTGRNDWVNAVVLQSDGRIVLGGYIKEVNSVSRNQLARLNPNGSLDLTFAPGARLNGEVLTLGLDQQGRLLAGGAFDDANGKDSRGIARFKSDGQLDRDFVMAPGVNGVIWTLTAAQSGSWLAGGCFDEANGLRCGSIVRLGPDGTPDSSLALNVSGTPEVWCLVAETDGRLLIGGRFSQVDGVRRNGIARLGSNGQLDPGFDPGAGINGTVYCLARDAAGLVWAGGSFNLVAGQRQHSVAAFLRDGTVVSSYQPMDWLYRVYAILPVPDGSLLAGGNFWEVGGLFNCFARLESGGALDFNLPLGWGANNHVQALLPLPDGRVLIGGLFNGVARAWHKGIARLTADGSVDKSFTLDLGDNARVYSLHPYPGSKVLAGGSFTAYNTSGLLRLAADGSVDSTMNAGSGPDGSIYGLGVQADSKILAVGNFARFNATPSQMVVRLNTNGSVDPTFQSPTDINASAQAVAIQPGRGIVVGGRFSRAGGRACTGLVRLNPGT